ncbi:MAG: hypothetical protein OIF58_11215 [Cohaesibacter sp.]|nr:hypothetical protein [Cohaesibacter sp.]
MSATAQIVEIISDVHDELKELGLTLDAIHIAIQKGYVLRSLCTENSPKTSKGTDSWRGTIEGLRDQVIKNKGEWRRANIENLPLVINDKRKVAIGVKTGCQYTGQQNKTPKTKNRSEAILRLAVIENGGTDDLFGYIPEKQTINDLCGYEFWLLLIHTTQTAIYAELSQPSFFSNSSERVNGWSRRIILPPFPLEETEEVTPEEVGDDFDFELTKKSV